MVDPPEEHAAVEGEGDADDAAPEKPARPAGEQAVAPSVRERLRLTEAGREQIKLRATFLKGIAIATFAVGTLATLARALLEAPAGHTGIAVGVTFSLVCFVISWAIHMVAYRHLRELDR